MNDEKDNTADDLEPLRLIYEQEAADYEQYKSEAAQRNYDEVSRTPIGGRFTVYGFNQTDRASVYVTATGEIETPIFERAMSDDRTGRHADYFRIADQNNPHSDIAERMGKLLDTLEAVQPSQRLSLDERQSQPAIDQDPAIDQHEASRALLREAEKAVALMQEKGISFNETGLSSAIHDARAAGITPATDRSPNQSQEQGAEFSAFRNMSQGFGRDRGR